MVSRTGGLWLALAAGLLVACATAPVVDSDHANVWGYLRLVPNESVPVDHAQAYSDRRMSGTALVDYSSPGFAVVYIEGATRQSEPLLLTIESSGIEPHFAAHPAGGIVRIANATESTHTISCPQAGRVGLLAPGEVLEISLGDGAHDFYLLDVDGIHSQVFAAPGEFSVVSSSGFYELTDLDPGPYRLHAWHPRFPPISTRAELSAGVAVRVDLEMGASRGER